MSIERELQRNYQEVFYPPMPEPEVQVAAGPTETVTDVNQPAFTMPGMGKRSKKSEVGQNLPIVAADVAAGGVKGLFSGVGGFGGDIQALYQGVKGVINRGGDERALDAFLRGMAQETILPTSDEVSKWLDKNIGPVVPAGANMSPEMIKARQAGANAGEFAGQLVADPFAAVGAGKALVKGAKALPKNLPVGMSTEAVGGLEGVLQPAKATAPASDIGFFSAVEQAALNIKRNSGTGQAMLNEITKGENVKADEIKWIGLDEFLKGKKNVTKQEVQDFIAANKVDVQEVTLGDVKSSAVNKEQSAANNLASLINGNDGSSIRIQGTQGNVFSDEALYYLQDGTATPNQFPPELQEAADRYLKAYKESQTASNTPSKFDKWQLPGGENYREILLTMPNNEDAAQAYSRQLYEKYGTPNFRSQLTPEEMQKLDSMNQEFKSSHWDEKNVLAHIRVNDRVDADGKKMLLVEEVQSDWHQAGRDKGYKGNPTKEKIEAGKEQAKSLGYGEEQIASMSNEQLARFVSGNAVPDAPMKDTWYQLALKRVLKYAADNGYERVGLTTGKQQAERFDLSKQVDEIAVPMVNADGGRSVRIDPTEGSSIKLMVDKDGVVTGYGAGSTQFSGKKLNEVIGKEMADKVMKAEADAKFSGLDLQVGGEGMKKYYDEIYPQFLSKYGKKWNAKVGETSINIGKDTVEPGISAPGIGVEFPAKTIPAKKEPVRYIDITPEMRQSVSKGQPLFSATGLATGAGAGTMATSQQEPQ